MESWAKTCLSAKDLDQLRAEALALWSASTGAQKNATYWVSTEKTTTPGPSPPSCRLETLAHRIVQFYAKKGNGNSIVGGEWWIQVRGNTNGCSCGTRAQSARKRQKVEEGGAGASRTTPPPAADTAAAAAAASRGTSPRAADTTPPPPTTTQTLLNFHWDKCERTRAVDGVYIHPATSTVTYLGKGVGGAPTVVLGHAVSKAGDLQLKHAAATYCSYAFPGKHVSFPGSALHGVPLGAGEAPCSTGFKLGSGGGCSCAASPRITFMVNLW